MIIEFIFELLGELIGEFFGSIIDGVMDMKPEKAVCAEPEKRAEIKEKIFRDTECPVMEEAGNKLFNDDWFMQ